MRRIPRPYQSIDSLISPSRGLRHQSSPSSCLACQSHLASLPSSPFSSTSRASIIGGDTREKETAFAAKWQKKIFGRNFGRVNPYDPNSPMRPDVDEEGKVIVQKKDEHVYGEEELDDEGKVRARARPKRGEEVIPYRPAKTWDGLDRVGGEAWAREKREGTMMRPSSYIPQRKIRDARELELALHEALVEVFTLRQAGMDLTLSSWRKSQRELREGLPWLDNVKIGPTSGDRSNISILFQDSATKDQLLAILTQTAIDMESFMKDERDRVEKAGSSKSPERDQIVDDVAEEELDEEDMADDVIEDEDLGDSEKDRLGDAAQRVKAEEVINQQVMVQNAQKRARKTNYSQVEDESTRWEKGWRSISLHDEQVKFAVVKRLIQLIGRTISDPIIYESKTVGQLLDHIQEPAKPKTVVESIRRLDTNASMLNQRVYKTRADLIKKDKATNKWKAPNVQLHVKKWKKIDEDKKLGRAKVIQYALDERELSTNGRRAARAV